MSNARAVVNEILGWAWNFMLFGTITYYVFERDQSGWWYLLVFAFHASSRYVKQVKEEE